MKKAEKHIVKTDEAPSAIGPYSQAIQTDSLVFVSGQLGTDPKTGNLVDNDIQAETRQVLTNLKNILAAAGSSLEDVVKTTIYLRHIEDFAKVNEVYAGFFSSNPPARATVEVSRLPKDANVEVDAIALSHSSKN